jgi:energy-coupling factor transporter ATP-binding protein EcfA2
VVAHLVVLVGPVGAGKSTVAGRLAQLVRQNGMTAADVDMDDVAFMQCGGDDLDEFWRRAAVATAGLIRAWFDAGVDVVITHGAFFESDGFEILQRAQSAAVDVHHVLFRVDPEVAVIRVRDDPTRGISRDPTFVRDSNARLRRLSGGFPVMTLDIDTTHRAPDEIAADVLAAFTSPTRRPWTSRPASSPGV